MLNIGTQELLLILLLALIVVGPQKLPELARSIGKGMRELRKLQGEVKDMVKVDLNPEPPTVHQPGVSAPRASRQPHRTARPASRSDDAPTGQAAASDDAGRASAASPIDSRIDPPHDAAADGPAPDGTERDDPPAAAGAG